MAFAASAASRKYQRLVAVVRDFAALVRARALHERHIDRHFDLQHVDAEALVGEWSM